MFNFYKFRILYAIIVATSLTIPATASAANINWTCPGTNNWSNTG